jgi:8-oxo-dGTP pyrophosphatase MutT (NUDIX family)
VTYPARNAVKVVLLNDANELLLMCMDDPTIRSMGDEYGGPFWTLIGGAIEPHESVRDAAEREILEETGLTTIDVEIGPLIWFGEMDLVLYDEPTHIRQEFLVGRTRNRNTSLAHLVGHEKNVVRKIQWFSLDQIIDSGEVIYPVCLPEYLPDVLAGRYPAEPFEIDLAAQPRR